MIISAFYKESQRELVIAYRMRLEHLKIFGVVTFYTVTAIASIITNKHYLKSVSIPLIFLLLQMVVSSTLLIIGYTAIKLALKPQNKTETSKVTIAESLRLFWPMIVCNVFGLAFNIICLSKIDAIMHQVTRGMTLPLTALLGPLLGVETGSWRVFTVCFAIFSGFVIAVSGDINAHNISFMGIAAGFMPSLINAYNAQFIKKRFVAGRSVSALDMVFYNNVYSTVLLTPFALLYEGTQLPKVNNWSHVLIAAVVTGVLGVLINYAGFLQIKVTSAVTHCVSSAARGVIQVLASTLVLHEKLSLTRSLGIGVSLVASAIYTVVKNYDNELKKRLKYEAVELQSISAINIKNMKTNKIHADSDIKINKINVSHDK